MKNTILALITCISPFLLCAQQDDPAHLASDESAVKMVVNGFLKAAGDYNIGAMPSLFAERANIGGVSFRDGNWVTYTMTIEEFMDVLRADSNPSKYTEPVSKYTIHITEGMLAFVKADATLYVNGRAKTYNYDYFTLIKENREWKILNGSYVAVPVDMVKD